MDKEKKTSPKPLKTFISFIAYAVGILSILIIGLGYWLSSPYTEPDSTSRFISKETDGFISIKFDSNDPGFSEVSPSIIMKIFEANKKTLIEMNIPQSFISLIENDEQRENIKLFLPYEVGYLFSFKKHEKAPFQILVINLRYFKNFFKLFLESLLQVRPKVVNVPEGNSYEKSLLLFPVFRDSSSKKDNKYITFYANDIIYLTNEKLFRNSIEAYKENKTPFFERAEVKDFYNKLIISENISFVADNREDSFSRFMDWRTKWDISKDFFNIIDIMAGNADVKKDDVITGLIYLSLKKTYTEKKLREEIYELRQELQETFHLNIDFQLDKDEIQGYYMVKFKCVGLVKLLLEGIATGSS